jgi:glyoxylase-like metal-dependent hydrolase (beta-lactamase superfamily II)
MRVDYDRISDRVLLVRGSPNTLIYKDDGGECYVIDPGYSKKRAKGINKLLEKCGRIEIILTHYHSDHSRAVEWVRHDSVSASSIDSCIMRSPQNLNQLTYGYPFSRESEDVLIKPVPISIDKVFSEGVLGEGIEALPLPGHTMGHMGIVIESTILYAGDSFFGERVLEKYKIPYHQNLIRATETLGFLKERTQSFKLVIPGHGVPLQPHKAKNIIEMNIRRNEEITNLVLKELSNKATSLEELTTSLERLFRVEKSIPTRLLNEVTVKGILSGLREEGRIEPIIMDGKVVWKAKKA